MKKKKKGMVSWRNWAGWLKGGIIYTLASTGLFLIGRQIYLAKPSKFAEVLIFPFSWLGRLLWPLIETSDIKFILLYVISVIQVFLIGASIGLIISRLWGNGNSNSSNNI